MVAETEYGEKVREPMEQSPAVIRGQEVDVFRRGSFYYLKGSNEAFTSRYYAEQAYRRKLVSRDLPKVVAAEKKAEKAAALGLISKKELKKTKDEQREWLERQ